jgi:uncharacterized protein (TIGR03067 family)
MTQGGQPAPEAVIKAASFVIRGDTFIVRFTEKGKSEDKAATLVVDPDQRPAAIDMTPKDGKDAGKPILGIMKVEKDTVTLCWADEAGRTRRPTEFTSTKDNKNFLIVMKRAK